MKVRAVTLLVAVGAVTAACSVRARPAALPPADDAGPPITYVAVGDSETVGIGTGEPLREAYPQQLYRQSLPRRAVFINLGISGVTVAGAAEAELSHALDAAPTLVTVWLGVNDLVQHHTAAQYEQELGDLVHRLRRGGATKVLVANTPPLKGLLVVTPPAVIDQFNEATARVAAREGAVLVDLHAAYGTEQAAGRQADFDGADGIHPAAGGQKAVADAFAKALAASGGVR